MLLCSSLRRLRAASILPLLALAAACGGDPSGAKPEPEPEPDRTVALVAGETHSCALTESGAMYCWGDNRTGQLGIGSRSSSAQPVRVTAPEPFVAISASHLQTCAVGKSGLVYCWGRVVHQDQDVLAVAELPSRTSVSSEPLFADVSAGLRHACATARDGRTFCWGPNRGWQATDGSVLTNLRFTSMQAAGQHSCGLAETGTAYCWGENGDLAFETAPAGVMETPRAVVFQERSFTSLAAGAEWTCGVSGGEVFCMGQNDYGERGTTLFEPFLIPRPNRVDGLPAIRAVFAARNNYVPGHNCALSVAGEAYCWGENRWGEVGDQPDLEWGCPGTICAPLPVRTAPALRFETLALGTNHTCGLTTGNEIYCWGRAVEGQLGPSGGAGGATPVKVELPES